MNTRQRLDEALVAAGLAPSRSRARDMVLRGTVSIDGVRGERPGQRVSPDAVLAVADPAASYVSRAALKLVAALDSFGYDPSGRVCLDLGSSTGGFTQVLLRRDARRVHAVDVGRDQLDPVLAGDPRVRSREGLNARELTAAHLDGDPIEAVVSDLSFISLTVALPPALALAASGAWGVFLVKPQFEVGREGIGRGGIVRDPGLAEAAAERVAGWLAARSGWTVDALIPSPIAGGDGNREFLLGGRHG
ncbi:TlyA family RNA methyltransferase [Propylenella binzhouense]|uniref:TlyA family RNA methyltransferase n=1 Tax=Propylenella binzhouense TaxID=2555902 RepID=A0A964WSE8_9HYPH|nr:TlyA family RNA methyltransferase [Propylenella binzhouense]MYZ46791.1 TlyA family RNA methyltransferase [Propylenella binzhouense]